MSGHRRVSTRHKIAQSRYAQNLGQKQRAERMIGWLIFARLRADDPRFHVLAPETRGIHLQVSGGVKYDSDLRDLVDNGYLEMRRYEYDGLATRKHGYRLSRSVLRITDAGREYLNGLGR